ncbi:hypothetical protein [Rhizobium rhododendri]|uniref:Membrane fusion protein biotin-lipoyl like domain-containing protein n=1 Tax=Rhizobium rhododendri TaxID=2506430 RepID=A0ABY8IPS8_9HYPH|nr:hypothetical protein [Rhizobium rhododendri]WFS25192.1 hypothetical protein PR018_23280 [Rhizobium rhododendri]
MESNRKTVQHLEGGIVSEIVAKEGDIVEPGDIVLRLDQTQALGTYTYLRDRAGLLRAQEARLVAESSNADVISLPHELLTKIAKQLTQQSRYRRRFLPIASEQWTAGLVFSNAY